MVLDVQLTDEQKELLLELDNFQGMILEPMTPEMRYSLVSLYVNGLIEETRPSAYITSTKHVIPVVRLSSEGRKYARGLSQ